MDPVDIFPPEISSEIIAYASLAMPIGFWTYTIAPVDILLDLTSVSPSWSDLIFATPALWTNISIDRFTHDSASKIVMQCNISKGCSLSIISAHILCTHNTKRSTDDRDLLVPVLEHRARVRELKLLCAEEFNVIAAEFGLFPCLTSIIIQPPHFYPEGLDRIAFSFIAKHPHLNSVQGMWFEAKEFASSWLPCLQSAFTALPLHKLASHLDVLFGIREMTFHFLEEEGSTSLEFLESYRVHTLPRLPWTRLIVGGGGVYDIHLHFWQNLDALVPAFAQNLTDLSCTMDLQLLSMLLPHLAECIRLLRLSVNLIIRGELVIESRPIKAAPVQILRIASNFEDLEKPNTSLLSMMMDCFLNLATISLLGQAAAHFVPLLYQSALPGLHTAILDLMSPPLNPFFALSTMIRKLELNCWDGELRKYCSEGVQDLHLKYRNPDASSDLILTDIDLSHWPSITDFHILGHHNINWSGTKLKHLQRIVLSRRVSDSALYRGTHLLYSLGRYPDTFPSLVELTLVPCIEWDIFFCFLEARTIHSNGTYSRMKLIRFVEVIPFGFTQLISKLLSGNKVERPSNFELSWVGNLDLIQDFSLPGCLECMKALHHCEAGVNTQPSPNYKNQPVLEDYPSNNDDVLSTWPARDEEWNRYAESHPRQRMCFEAHYSTKTTKITAHGYYVS